MSLVYIDIDQAIDIHGKTVEVSGGGTLQKIDTDRLESVLQHIQNDEYYPTFEEKITHLVFCSIQFHCFADGNKRIGIALGAKFLLNNGYLLIVSQFIKEMENISYHVAAGKIDKDFLLEIITAIINGEYDSNEDIKLRLIEAIG
jgi:death on curing protein